MNRDQRLKKDLDNRALAETLKLHCRFPPILEDLIYKAILEHRTDDESLAETFGRLMRLAELKLQEMEQNNT